MTNRVKISPSILAADQADLKNEVLKAEAAGADMIHVDVTDGHFAPNISFGPDTVRALRRVTRLPLDVHLMIEEPSKFLQTFLEAGSDILTVHAEVLEEKQVSEMSKTVRAKGRKIGLALKPSTPLPSWLGSSNRKIDQFLVLTVNPGFPGQLFIPNVLPKVGEIRSLVNGDEVEIEVDGGVDQGNAATIVKAGATVLVAGASIFRKGDVKTAMHEMRSIIDRSTQEVSA